MTFTNNVFGPRWCPIFFLSFFLYIFRRHQLSFQPGAFWFRRFPPFFYYWEFGGFSHFSIYAALLLYRSICIHTIGKRRRRHQRFPTGSSSSSLRCGWCQPPGDSADASTCSSFFPPSTFSFLGGGRASPAPLDVSLQVCVCHVSYLTIRLRFPPNRLSLQTLHRVPSFAFEMSTAKWCTILGSFQVLPTIFSCCQRIKEREKSFTDWGRLVYI